MGSFQYSAVFSYRAEKYFFQHYILTKFSCKCKSWMFLVLRNKCNRKKKKITQTAYENIAGDFFLLIF